VEVVSDAITVQELETYDQASLKQQACRRTGDDKPEKQNEDIPPEVQANPRKRSHEHTSGEDVADKRVRAKTDNTPQSATTADDLFIPLSVHTGEPNPDITQIMTSLAAVTGQIVATIKDESSNSSETTRKAVVNMLRDVLEKLLPCVTEVHDRGALGIEIVGLAALIDPSLGREGIFTIISSPYASRVPRSLNLDYIDYFAIGDMFWDRVGEFLADPNLKPGEKAAPSSQGLFCTAWRLHVVTNVTPRNIWTAVCRLSSGTGVSHLPKDELWMQMHLHDHLYGQLPRSGLAKANGTPHASLTYERDPSYRGVVVDENTHFSAVDAVPHKPSDAMVPVGRLDQRSRALFQGVKLNAHNPEGRVILRPDGMSVAAVERGLALAGRSPGHQMPLPNSKRTRNRLFNRLSVHPSNGGPMKLLQDSTAFSSTYLASQPKGEQPDSSINPSQGESSDKVSSFQIVPQTASCLTSHP
jgi:hypothetical protein